MPSGTPTSSPQTDPEDSEVAAVTTATRRRPPARDFSRRRRQTLPDSAEQTLVQLALVSDELAGAEAELGAVGRLQAGPAAVTVALAHA